MKPNARPEPLGMAGATQERTLFPVGSRPLFGPLLVLGSLRTAFSAPLLVPPPTVALSRSLEAG